MTSRLLTIVATLIFSIVNAQTKDINSKLLTNISNKFIFFDDGSKGMMFKLKYDGNIKTIQASNIKAYSTNDVSTPSSLKLVEVGGSDKTELKFEDATGRSTLRINFKSPTQTSGISVYGLFENTRIVSFDAELGTEAVAKAKYKKPAATPVATKSSTEFSSEESVRMYLDGKKFKSSTGTEVKIGYSSEVNSYGISINGKLMFFNLTYSLLTKYTAVVKGESTTDNGMLKIVVDGKTNTLTNNGTVYKLQ